MAQLDHSSALWPHATAAFSVSAACFASRIEWMFANDMTESPESADMEVCAAYLKALGDPVRLQVVRALRAGPLSVSDLALLLDLDIANVSHHLRVLYHAKLVTTTRDGKFIYYTLNGDFLTGRAAKKALDFGCCQVNLPS